MIKPFGLITINIEPQKYCYYPDDGGQWGNYTCLLATLSSPLLSVVRRRYRTGGDSVWTGDYTDHSYAQTIVFDADNAINSYRLRPIKNMIQYAQAIESGEKVELIEPLSNNWLEAHPAGSRPAAF